MAVAELLRRLTPHDEEGGGERVRIRRVGRDHRNAQHPLGRIAGPRIDYVAIANPLHIEEIFIAAGCRERLVLQVYGLNDCFSVSRILDFKEPTRCWVDGSLSRWVVGSDG